MAKRQFTKTDTQRWRDKFTNGIAGIKIYTSSKLLDSTDGFYTSTILATEGDFTATLSGIADGVYNLPCKVVQNQGVGANDDPNWEFNKLISVTSNVGTFKYPFTKDYIAGAQMVTGNPYKSITINPGVTLTIPAWSDSLKGAEMVFFARDLFNNLGTLELRNIGFRGGDAVGGTSVGRRGEGWEGRGNDQVVNDANGQGGGAGGYSNNGPWNQGNGGGGGGNSGTPGTSGIGTGGGNNSNGAAGPKGDTVGNAQLSNMPLGGAGGSGGAEGSGNSGKGATGPGNLTIVAKDVRLGTVLGDGTKGDPSGQFHKAAGGSSAGFCCTIRCQRATLTTNAHALGGPRVDNYNNGVFGDADGGAGDNGRFAVYAPRASRVTGNTNPAATIIEDSTMNDNFASSVLVGLLE